MWSDQLEDISFEHSSNGDQFRNNVKSVVRMLHFNTGVIEMGAPRKHAPANAVPEIRRLASAGSTYVGIAKHFGVAKETLNRWIDDDPELLESFEQGKDEEIGRAHV